MTGIKWIDNVEGITEDLTNKMQNVFSELDIPIKEVTIEVSNYKAPICLAPGKVPNKVLMLQLHTGVLDRETIGFFPHNDSNDIEPIIYKDDLEKALITLWLKGPDTNTQGTKESLAAISRLKDKLRWVPLQEDIWLYPSVLPGEYSYFFTVPVHRTSESHASAVKTGKGWKALYARPDIISTPEPITLISKEEAKRLAELEEEKRKSNLLKEVSKYKGWVIKEINLDSIIITDGVEETSIVPTGVDIDEYYGYRTAPLQIADYVLE